MWWSNALEKTHKTEDFAFWDVAWRICDVLDQSAASILAQNMVAISLSTTPYGDKLRKSHLQQ
jgi:hypothetical protein